MCLWTVAECVCVCKPAEGSWGWGSEVGNQGQEELTRERSLKRDALNPGFSARVRRCPSSAQTVTKLEEAAEPWLLPRMRASGPAAVLASISPASRTQLRITHRLLPLGRLSQGRKKIRRKSLPQSRA